MIISGAGGTDADAGTAGDAQIIVSAARVAYAYCILWTDFDTLAASGTMLIAVRLKGNAFKRKRVISRGTGNLKFSVLP